MKAVRKLNAALALVVAIGTICAWTAFNQPLLEPQWPATVGGFAFSPLQRGQTPVRSDFPDAAQLDADLALLASHASTVRTYSIDGDYATIPAIAARYGLDVTVGVSLDDNRRSNEMQLDRLGAIGSQTRNVKRAIVGNETLLTETLSLDELTALLKRARRNSAIAIGTAEPWHIWMRYPELAEQVDFIAVHLLPYWEGISIDAAVDYVVSRMDLLAATFPDKPIVIGEVGWPSHGRSRGDAVASIANAETFLRRFLRRADEKGYDYFLMEAFDQPWKRYAEGEVGAYWGVFDVDRQAKYDFAGAVTPLPNWQPLALAAALLACAAFWIMVTDGRRLRFAGRAFVATVAAATATASVFSLAVSLPRYWNVFDALGAVLLLGGVLGVVILVLVEAHEWAESLWCRRANRVLPPSPEAQPTLPTVSIHVPIYKEPPELVAETLRALADLDYPSFEVIVVDNNTKDERLWKPVELLCASLGEAFRFFHVDPLAGYKAGALNFALEYTAPDANIIAVIDSDYKVERTWLRDLVTEFVEPRVAIVQAPQDYRDGSASLFKSMCEAEYRGFFKIGMLTRNDRNAIIQHGTMTMIRKKVLVEVGGWDTHTVTEDAELGLRVLEHGYEARYSATTYGRGLTPDNFNDYKVQRARWARGAGQILRMHGTRLVGAQSSALDRGQRYHFVAGWLPWLADGLSLVFNVVAIVWSLLIMLAPARFFPPLATFSGFAIGLFAFKLVKMIVLYRWRVGAGLGQTLGAAVAGLGLVYTVGHAIIVGLTGREAPFRRTPKLARRHSLVGALAAAAPEAAIASTLLACAAGVSATAPFASTDATLWSLLLVVFAVPHLSAIVLSLASALPRTALGLLPRGLEGLAGDSRRG